MKQKRFVAHALIAAMTISCLSGIGMSSSADAAAAKPKLSTASKTITVGSKFKLSVKKVKAVKAITKTTWKTSKKKVAALKKAGKTSVTVVAKVAGNSKITASVKYKLKNGKSKTAKLTCKVKVALQAPSTTAPSLATTAPSTVPATKVPVVDVPKATASAATPTVAPTATPIPSPVPYYQSAGYYAGYDGNKSFKGKDNLYVNYVMVDSKSVNKQANIVKSLKFKIDSNSAFEIGVYVSDANCAAATLGDSAKVGSFTTDGTIGQEVSLDIAGTAIDSLEKEKISFGFYSTAAKEVQQYCLHEMYVGYNNEFYPVSLSENTVGCTGSSKGIYATRTKDSSAVIKDDYTPLCELTEAKGYKFGTCVTYDQIMGDKEFCNLVAKHCDSITATNEFKAYSLLNQSGCAGAADGMPVMDYSKADAICKWAKDNGLQIRGHALVWDQSMKSWFFNEGYAEDVTDADGKITNRVDSETARKRLESYIDQVITHFEKEYPGVIYCWDVVNEGVDTEYFTTGDACKIRTARKDGDKVVSNPFYDVIGNDYIQYSFKCAKDTLEKLNNTTIQLVYNDFNVIYGDKRTPILNLVKKINSYDGTRKLCDCVGMQGYLGYDNQGNCLKDDLVTNVINAITDLSKAGVKVQLTEMAMRNFTNSDKYMADHAKFAKNLFSKLADINTTTNNAFCSMSIWAFIDDPYLNYTDDDYEYDIYTPYSGLFDEVFTPKDSFREVYTALGGNLPE